VGVQIPVVSRIFSTSSRPALGHTQPPINILRDYKERKKARTTTEVASFVLNENRNASFESAHFLAKMKNGS
jgi:hypothetical protein